MPKEREKVRTRHNSTIRITPKKLTLNPSPSSLRKPVTPRKPIPKSNPANQAKAVKRSAKKHRAYMASECRRLVDARANGQCEFGLMRYQGCLIPIEPVWFPDHSAAGALFYPSGLIRCQNTDDLAHHHRSYHNYGGGEEPKQMLKGCPRCHDFVESLKPARNRFARNR